MSARRNGHCQAVAVCVSLALAVLLTAGCATHADRLREVRGEFYGGDLSKAAATLERDAKKVRREGDVLKLDRAIVALCDGKPAESERLLREVRDSFDYLEQASAAEAALSALTDDNRLSYSGEDYEKILIRVFLALSNLMGDGGDATAYALQVNDVQQRIIQSGADSSGENLKLKYKRVALGAYLYGAIREETHVDFDDVIRCSAAVAEWEPRLPLRAGRPPAGPDRPS